MRILVVGSGGREHALVWKLKQSPKVEKIFCAPGNAGIAADAECVPIKVEELEKLADFAQKEKIDLTVAGPEAPLCLGLGDVFRARNLAFFGPSGAAARLEGSKEFAKEFMRKYDIPTARAAVFSDAASAEQYVRDEFSAGRGVVVKADGLAAGKGVLVAENADEAIDFVTGCFTGKFGEAGSRVLIEEKLEGEEATVLALVDGKKIVPLASAQDHKRVFDGDKGPNTGGMGAYSPAPVVTDEVAARIDREIVRPFLAGIQQENLDFRGVIFFGLMIDRGEPKVLEFNVRFGDPEVQPVLRRFKGDFAEVLADVAAGKLDPAKIGWLDEAAVSVVIAAGGYPGPYKKGVPIYGLDEAAKTGAVVFHAGTAFADGKIVSAGGRMLGVSALGRDIAEAIANAYRGVDLIRCEGAFCRRDIGHKALERR